MDRFIHRENIAHYRRLLAEADVTTDQVRHELNGYWLRKWPRTRWRPFQSKPLGACYDQPNRSVSPHRPVRFADHRGEGSFVTLS